LVLISTSHDLLWQDWDDVYIVYQPSSAETHVFNETTATILRGLEYGPLATEALKDWTEATLGVGQGELAADDFTFASARLEELGLIDCLDESLATQ
jgi:PqqD family protein of HPr-rel-A system